jgi:hypothetical protein
MGCEGNQTRLATCEILVRSKQLAEETLRLTPIRKRSEDLKRTSTHRDSLVLTGSSALLKLPRLVECEGKWCEHPQYSRKVTFEDEREMTAESRKAESKRPGYSPGLH